MVGYTLISIYPFYLPHGQLSIVDQVFKNPMSFEKFKIEQVPKSNSKVDNIAGTQGIHLYTYNTNNKHQWTYIFDYLDTKDKWYQFTWTNTAISLRINAQITSQHMVGVSLMRGINNSWPISAACKKGWTLWQH